MKFQLHYFLATCAFVGNVMAGGCISNSPVNQAFSLADGQALLSDFQTGNINGFSDDFPLNALSFETETTGSAKVTIENDFLFENTHVFFSSVASAVQQILDQCCEGSTQDPCFGGKVTIQGDSGLDVDVTLSDINS